MNLKKNVKLPRIQLIIVISFIVLGQNVAQGFFIGKIEVKEEPNFILNQTEDFEHQSHRLLLIDNATGKGGDNLKKKMLFDNSGIIFYLDQLPIPEVVLRSNDQKKTSELSIDSLLYANLRIVRLMNEYEGLKKRSQSVLEGLDIPYLKQYINLDKVIGDNNKNISERMNRLFSETKMSVDSGTSGQGSTNQKGINSVMQFRQFVRNKPLFKQSSPIKNYQANKATNNSSQRDIDSKKDQSNIDIQGEGPHRIPYGADKNEKLPWPFPLLFSVFEYLLNNKIEAIIYLLVLTWSVHFVFKVFNQAN